MKRVSLRGILCAGLAMLFFLTLGFFTLYGGEVYRAIHPEVKTMRVKYEIRLESTGERYIVVPRSAVTQGGAVFVVTTEQGFSMELSTVDVREVTVSDYVSESFGAEHVCLSEGLQTGALIVTEGTEGLTDGMRVVVLEG